MLSRYNPVIMIHLTQFFTTKIVFVFQYFSRPSYASKKLTCALSTVFQLSNLVVFSSSLSSPSFFHFSFPILLPSSVSLSSIFISSSSHKQRKRKSKPAHFLIYHFLKFSASFLSEVTSFTALTPLLPLNSLSLSLSLSRSLSLSHTHTHTNTHTHLLFFAIQSPL